MCLMLYQVHSSPETSWHVSTLRKAPRCSSPVSLRVVIDGNARAYPHNIFWHHEITNDRSSAAGQPKLSGWSAVHDCALSPAGNGRLIGVDVVGTRSAWRDVDGAKWTSPLGCRTASPYRAARLLLSHTACDPTCRGSGGRLVSSAVFKTVQPG